MTRQMRRTLRALAALALVALVGAGCSDGSAENGSGGGKQNATIQDETLSFADCMRENGVPDFPDPDASDDQAFAAAIESLDQTSAAWKKAIGACKDLRPPGLLGGKANPQQMQMRLEVAQCMRDNGVEDFPDPTADGPLIDTRRIPSAAGRGALSIPGFQAAMDACRDVMADALGGP